MARGRARSSARPFGVRREPLVEVQHLLIQRSEALVAVVLLRECQPGSMLRSLALGTAHQGVTVNREVADVAMTASPLRAVTVQT